MKSFVFLTCLFTLGSALQFSTKLANDTILTDWTISNDGKVVAGIDRYDNRALSVSKDSGLTYQSLTKGLFLLYTRVSYDGNWIAAIDESNLYLFNSTLQQVSVMALPSTLTYFDRNAGKYFLQMNMDASQLVLNYKSQDATPLYTLYFYTRDGNKLSLYSQKTAKQDLTFSASLDTFVGLRAENATHTVAYPAVFDFLKGSIQLGSPVYIDRKFQYNNGVQIGANNIAMISFYSTVYTLNMKTNELRFPFEKYYINYLRIVMSNDGNYIFMFMYDDVIRRYLVTEKGTYLPYDTTVAKVQARDGVTTNFDGSLLIYIHQDPKTYHETMATTQVSMVDGASSVCASQANCDTGLTCGVGGYCYKSGTKADLPNIREIKYSKWWSEYQLFVEFTWDGSANSTTCERAGSISSGNPVDSYNQFYVYNNTFVDVSFTLANGAASPWVVMGTPDHMLGRIGQIWSNPQILSDKMNVRVRVQCEDDNMSNSYVQQLKVPYTPVRLMNRM